MDGRKRIEACCGKRKSNRKSLSIYAFADPVVLTFCLSQTANTAKEGTCMQEML